jgi:hypothetical protein
VEEGEIRANRIEDKFEHRGRGKIVSEGYGAGISYSDENI